MNLGTVFLWALYIVGFFATVSGNEGLLAKAPRMKSLLDNFEFRFVKVLTWRANANIREEIQTLMKHFGWTSILFGIFVFIAARFHQEPLRNWLTYLCSLSALAWLSFRWTFKHTEVVRPMLPTAWCALGLPWIVYVLDSYGGTSTLADAFKKFSLMSFAAESNFVAALVWFGLICAVILTYYGVGWLVLSPFAYLMLGCLKMSRMVSRFLLAKFKKAIWYDCAFLIIAIVYLLNYPK